MTFDWTVNLGSVINAVSLLFVASVGARKLGGLELKLDLLWSWYKKEHNIEESD